MDYGSYFKEVGSGSAAFLREQGFSAISDISIPVGKAYVAVDPANTYSSPGVLLTSPYHDLATSHYEKLCKREAKQAKEFLHILVVRTQLELFGHTI